MSSNNTNTIINPKPCIYNCNTRIYWNVTENAYFEVFTKQKHICKNRNNNNNNISRLSTEVPKPKYYNKFAKQQFSKPKMSNSLELLQGPISEIQKKYEILSDIVLEANGKVHGSQSHIVTAANNNSIISLIVYYEVSEGQRDEVKHKFGEYFRTNLVAL